MKNELWGNGKIRAFSIVDGMPNYWQYTSVWRIMFTRNTFIVKSLLPSGYDDLQLIDGANVHLTRSVARQMDEYEKDNVIMVFNNCKLHRKWSMYPMALSPDELQAVIINAEFKFSDYQILGL